MDPDLVAAAGVHPRRLPDTTTSAGGGRSDDSWARAVLRRACDMSRKAAIAGAAATAAPVVAPPLLVLCTAGLALSVPFAAYLASLAAANRLMGVLLPSSPAQPDHTYDQEDDGVEQEFLDASEDYGQEAPVSDYWGEREEGTVCKEENESVTPLPLSRDPGVSKVPVPTLADEEADVVVEGIAVQESVQDTFASNDGDKLEFGTTTEGNEYTKETPSLGFDVSELLVPMLVDKDNAVQREVEDEVAVEMVVQEATSSTDIIRREVTDVRVDVAAIAAAPETEAMLPGDHLAPRGSQQVVEAAYDGDMVGITVMKDIVRELDDVTMGAPVERRHDQEGVCSFVSLASVVRVHDVEDVIPSGSTPCVSAIGDEMIVESRPDGGQSDRAAGMGYTVMNEAFERKVVAADENHYTEEQLREQLDILRTITGYRAAPSSTLEGELAGLYIFVGVEPPVSSSDTSDLMELNAKLQFLKSIIGVD